MRLLLALAAAVALSSGPARAQQCDIAHATYTLRDAPAYRLEFRFDREMRKLAETASPTAYYDLRASLRHRSGVEIAEFIFYSPSYSTAKTQVASVASSRYLEQTIFHVVAFNADFSRSGVPYSDGAAPSALIMSGVAEALASASAELREGSTRKIIYDMPEGAWVLAHCR